MTSNRKTSEWTTDLEEAFGKTGIKGNNGERWVAEMLIEYGIPAKISKDHRKMQTSGVDIFAVMHFDFSADVKNNVKSNGNFPIYFKWLYDPEKFSEYIIHVNPETKKMYWYLRDEAQQYFNDVKRNQSFVWYERGNYFPFVSVGWDRLIIHIESNS